MMARTNNPASITAGSHALTFSPSAAMRLQAFLCRRQCAAAQSELQYQAPQPEHTLTAAAASLTCDRLAQLVLLQMCGSGAASASTLQNFNAAAYRSEKSTPPPMDTAVSQSRSVRAAWRNVSAMYRKHVLVLYALYTAASFLD